MEHVELVAWLKEDDPGQLATLWQRADAVRRENVGAQVHLRGLIEFTNHCQRHCLYCGLRFPNQGLARYRMTADEILECAHTAVRFGYGTVVLQSGEDTETDTDWVCDLIQRIKRETPLGITLGLGERSEEDLRAWHAAGANRYLLRFETSNLELFHVLHPPRPGAAPSDRLGLLHTLRQIGYEVGSGVMIGIPGQSYDDLARDIELFAMMDLDMIGVGPYLAHPSTPLANEEQIGRLTVADQVPSNELMTYKVVALTRLMCPRVNIPATTALATLNRVNGREQGLQRGANIIMPNLTPTKYRALYEIYPEKACVGETAEACHLCLEMRIKGMGREVGRGRGDSPNFQQRDLSGESR